MKNIVFIGGIHGVGKGTICRDVCKELNIDHLSASEILKWNEISKSKNKLVSDFAFTQNRLISNLNEIVEVHKRYLLDGHVCRLPIFSTLQK